MNSKHFKRINGLITSISCFLSKSTAETLFCFQSKENRLTFPTRERVWVLKCEDINVKYYSDLPSVNPDLPCTSSKPPAVWLNYKSPQWETEVTPFTWTTTGVLALWDSPVRRPPHCCYELWLNLLILLCVEATSKHQRLQDERRTKWFTKNYNHALMWIHTHNRQTTRCSCQACQICTF